MKIQNKKTKAISFITPEGWEKLKTMGDQNKFKILDKKAEQQEQIADTEINEIDLHKELMEVKTQKPKQKKTKKHGSEIGRASCRERVYVLV